jgi:uncharacterized lipoprotein YddW (UPF0748 family)
MGPMTLRARLVSGFLLAATLGMSAGAAVTYVPSATQPPALQREFRGAWVATLGNIDWPSTPGLSTAEQKAEMIALLERAVRLKLNAILLQVRPASDALYASNFEPWSEYLQGRMGKAPSPFYDPLEFAVAEAHYRGLELHAWFNPFRARHKPAKDGSVAANHVTQAHPDWVRRYGSQHWLEPGDTRVHDHVIAVMMDVVRRYDIDGLVIDDYFYPYPEKDVSGKVLPFPDDAAWKAFQAAGGTLDRGDWRRENVNRFVQRLYNNIKKEKAWVKFGVSPFGIWHKGTPAKITGMDAYGEIYTDSRKWFASGWLDYLAPQLYWSIAAPGQSFPVLLKWWRDQNDAHRHLWPSIATSRIGSARPPEEILDQIKLTRKTTGVGGVIQYSAKPLILNREGIANKLSKDLYKEPALVPASPWLTANPPPKPALWTETNSNGGLKFVWAHNSGEKPRFWVLQTKTSRQWSTQIVPPDAATSRMAWTPGKTPPEVVSVMAVDRAGNASAAIVLGRK